MEEKKLNPRNIGGDKKLTYEQLNTVCAELHQQNQALLRQLQQVNMTNMFRRLDYLFLVLQHAKVFNDKEFVDSCAAEIKDALIIKKDDEEGKEV